MPYWKCYYHVIWATKQRQPVITPVVETIILNAVQQKCTEMGCNLLAANTALDHVHVAMSIPPAMAVAEAVANLKGTSSRAVNLALEQEERFRWQESYGVLTFGERGLAMVCDYIKQQKEHHQAGSLNEYLERLD